ncbi:MAG TPA: type II secretion system F family protein [Tepidisphaeraceae bacterium]|nr:type II secretion system F family protein [Tepidisphaeraceae bacterium]
MTIDQMLIVGCTFGAVVLAGYFVSLLLASRGDEKHIRDRLREKPRPGPRPKGQGLMPLLHRIGQAAAEPFMPKTREKQSGVRQSLARAGIYSPSAVKLVTGCKVIFLGLGLVVGYVVGVAADLLLLGVSFGGLIGYLLPVLWLRRRIMMNQRDLTYGLADALDLMVVCVESGLTVDAAMQRVGQELSLVHPALSRELGIAHMETRVGLARTEALRNLGNRTGNAAVQSLVAMLVQADRFGTSIAQALRIHADTLRQNRQFAAEEMAAKASVKMTFPLVLFVFPATFIILAGPSVIKMMKSM